MYCFINDYSVIAHPNIMKRMAEINLDQHIGYGFDEICKSARHLLRIKIGNPWARVFFVVGGTQANMSVISSLLKSAEAAICANTGHIFVHETGAIEATGHRVITIDTPDGKLTPALVEKVLSQYKERPHVVKPKLVYISNSTEIGTIYNRAEIKALHDCCKAHNLFFFCDGARIGSALTSEGNDLTLHDFAELTDVFYIGGTKNGALMGEAVIFNDPKMGEDYDMVMKQRGALLAKGWILGLQFYELFKDDLYWDLARHANQMAKKISSAFKDNDFKMLTDSHTNQVFPILTYAQRDKLSEKWGFELWSPIDDEKAAYRFVAAWNTDEEMVEDLCRDIKKLRDLEIKH